VVRLATQRGHTGFNHSGNAIVCQYPFFYEKIKMILLRSKYFRNGQEETAGVEGKAGCIL
jgi:hypothetical protein